MSHARAVVFSEAGRLELRDVDVREPSSTEVVVDTAYSSISAGTERLLFNGALPGFPALRFPLVPGYEAAGVVSAIGADVAGIAVGDEVFVGGSMCYTDVAAAFGGQSSRLVKSAAHVVPLDGIPLAHAPILALAATALHGVRRLEAVAGDLRGARVAVVGLGAIGQLTARFLRSRGATVIGVDPIAERRAESGVDLAIDSVALAAPADAPAHHGHGHQSDGPFGKIDAVIEASGRSAEIATAARLVAPGGAILLLSYYDVLATPYLDVFVKEAVLIAAREWNHDDLLAARDDIADGTIDVASLARHVMPVDAFEAAYRTAFEDPTTLKVLLKWA